jgi:hypothetical protein
MDDHLAMELAAQQYSLITYAQARRAGWTRHQIQLRLDDGILIRVHRGVYRFASSAVSPVQCSLAACLATGPPAAASHRRAAAIHEIWTVPDTLVEVTVARTKAPELDGVVVHRIADLSTRWIATIDGVPVTTPARTLVDLGAVLPLGSVSRALDRAIGRQLVSLSEVRSALDAVARKGRAGAGVIRVLLDERQAGPGPAGVLEARMHTLVRQHGLPELVPEFTVLDEHGQFVARVDFAYPELKYAIEVDGYEPHASLRAFRLDRARQNDLVELGWIVHRFTWDDIERHPLRVANRVRRRHAQLLGSLKPLRAA